MLKSRSILVAGLVLLANVGLRAQSWEGDRAAQQQYHYGMRAYPFGRVPQNARLEACLFSDARMAAYRSGSGTQRAARWAQIGPFDLAGRVTSIAMHPSDGRTLWIGAADGGVWKSTNRGASWAPVMDNEDAIAMGAVAVDPSNPDVLYAGTGEASPFIDAYGGGGMMKSTDGGATWRNIGLRSVGAFSRIVVHPRAGNIVLAAAIKNNGGLYRSSDAGATWARVLGVPVTDITVNPANPDEMWIGGGGHPVMRSTDAGRTFAPSASGIATSALAGRVSVQVAPSAPTVLYALAHEFEFFPQANYSRIYKSVNSGASWQLVMDSDPDFLNYYGIVQGEYNNVIAIAPDNPDVVVAGGVVLMRTTDGGGSWNTYIHELHPDHHAVAFDPADPRRLYIGNDGGMYANDGGSVFQRITSGLAITQFYAMAVDQTVSDLTYGGTQDNGTVTTEAVEYRTGGPGIVGGGDGFHIVVDRIDPNVLYYEQPYGRIIRKDRSNGSEGIYTQGIPSDDPGAWSAPLIADPGDSTALYCGRTRVYRRTTSTSWVPLSPAFRTPVSAIAVSPLDPRIIYAGSGLAAGSSILASDGVPLGELRVSTDRGATWHERNRGLPNRIITDFAVSSRDTCVAFVAYSGFYSGHIFKTTDCGANWKDISVGLPDIPVNTLVLHPDDDRIIYAGTDIGVYITTDGGGTWWTYNDGLPRVAVVDMEIHRASRTLRVATHGRSMWQIPLETPAVTPQITSPTGRAVWMGQTRKLVAWSGLQAPVSVQFALDGSNFRTVADSVSGNTYEWTVPDSATTTARLRVAELGGSGVATSAAFTIESFRPGGLLAATSKAYPCWGLAHDGEFLWASVENSDTLLKLDPLTLATLDIVKVRQDGRHRFTDITWHDVRRTFFVHEVTDASPDTKGGAWMLEVARDGTVLHRWPSPCYYPTGLVWLPGVDGGVLLASDLFGGQELYLIDPADGSVKRTVTPATTVELGPAGLASIGDGRGFWRVIADFDPNSGPRGSSVGRYTLDDAAAACSFPLAITPDSTTAAGYSQWGRLFARGVERNPADGSLWITNLDGAIYNFTPCEPLPSGVRVSPSVGSEAAILAVIPSPAVGPSRVDFSLRRGAWASLELFDIAGSSVPVAARYFEAGTHSVTFDPAGLASGIYQLRLNVDGRSVSVQGVVVVR